MSSIRLAAPGEVQSIGALIETVWPPDTFLADVCRTQIAMEGGAALHIAEVDQRVAGMVSAFPVLGRWEVDLLAVHPDYRRRGLAPRLIAASVIGAREHGHAVARAVICEDNVPSQRAFARVGFRTDKIPHELVLIRPLEATAEPALPSGWSLVPIETLVSRATWLEPGSPYEPSQLGGLLAAVHAAGGASAMLPPQFTDLRAHGGAVSTYHIWEMHL